MRKLHLSRHNVVSSWRTVVSLVQLKIAGGTLTYNNHVRDLNMAPRYVGLPKCTVVIYSADMAGFQKGDSSWQCELAVPNITDDRCKMCAKPSCQGTTACDATQTCLANLQWRLGPKLSTVFDCVCPPEDGRLSAVRTFRSTLLHRLY